MKSRITIEIDFEEQNSPIIEVRYEQSDDVRDKLIKSFFEKLGGQSSWCRVMFWGSEAGRQLLRITPITPSEFEVQAKLMALMARDKVSDFIEEKGTTVTK